MTPELEVSTVIYPYLSSPDSSSSIDGLHESVNTTSPFNFTHGITFDQFIFDTPWVRLAFYAMYTVVFCLCFFGNLAVVVVVTCHWRMRSVTKFCMGNLAFANLFVGVFCIYQNLSTFLTENWVFGRLLCKMYYFTNSLSHTASILILVVICVERYLCILHPLRCRQILTIQRLRLMFAGVWILSGLICSPRLYYITTFDVPFPSDSGGQEHEVICAPKRTLYDSRTADMIYFVLLFLLPLLVMSLLYSRIGAIIWKSSAVLQGVTLPEASGVATVSAVDSTSSLPQVPNNSFVSEFNSRGSVAEPGSREMCHGNMFRMRDYPQRRYRKPSPLAHVPPDPGLGCKNHNNNNNNNTNARQVGKYSRGYNRILRVSSASHIDSKDVRIKINDITRPGSPKNRLFPCLPRFGSSCGSFKNILLRKKQVVQIGLSWDDSNPRVRTVREGAVLDPVHPPIFRLIQVKDERRGRVLQSRQAAIRMLIAIVITFAVCNFPFHLRKICQYYVPSYNFGSYFSQLVTPLTFLLMYTNCAVNPILFAFMSKNFRASLRDLLQCRVNRPAPGRGCGGRVMSL